MTRAGTQRALKLLVVTSLYPNSVQTRHGIFVEERLRSLLVSGAVTARVIAPVPWFPLKHPRFGRYADFAAVPAREVRYGIEILHPHYPVVPRIGMTLGPTSMATAVVPAVKQMLSEGYDFDLIDAHYFYPDGVAAARLSRRFQRPVVITARGTDVNKIPEFRVPRRQIMDAARQAVAIITVSRALRDSLIKLGVKEKKITPLRNGVDLERFAPIAPDLARSGLDCTDAEKNERIWLSVGHLVENKGVHVTIRALARAPGVTLLVVGTGPEEARLHTLAARYGVVDRVLFLGHVEHDALPVYFSAADALVLPARTEGMPNVVLEAMACGAAVIATSVGGIPEVVQEPVAGALMRERTSEAVIAAWHTVCQYGIDQHQRDARRAYAQRFSWSDTARGQLTLFRRIVDGNGARDCAAGRQAGADPGSVYEDGER